MGIKKKIAIITEAYPFEGGDLFLHDEFHEINKHYKTVVYFPLKATGMLAKNLPKNVYVNTQISNFRMEKTNQEIVKKLQLLLKVYLVEIRKGKRFFEFISQMLYIKSIVKMAFSNARVIEAEIQKYGKIDEFIFYSTWMNLGSLTFSVMKDIKLIDDFFFRVNGFDIFDERRKGNYMLLRAYNYKMATKVIVLSEVGLDYLKRKKVYPEKLTQNYSGIYNRGVNPINNQNTFTLVSCSNLIELKRVSLIVASLNYIHFPLTWYHFGDGPEYEMVKEMAQKLPANIEVRLMKYKTQIELVEFYLSIPVNLFIHLSRTEGLGMSIIEAQSFGIPALCCDAGGVKDVVNEKTGILIPVNTDPKSVAAAITRFAESNANHPSFRESIQLAFLAKFEIQANFKKLENIFDSVTSSSL